MGFLFIFQTVGKQPVEGYGRITPAAQFDSPTCEKLIPNFPASDQ